MAEENPPEKRRKTTTAAAAVDKDTPALNNVGPHFDNSRLTPDGSNPLPSSRSNDPLEGVRRTPPHASNSTSSSRSQATRAKAARDLALKLYSKWPRKSSDRSTSIVTCQVCNKEIKERTKRANSRTHEHFLREHIHRYQEYHGVPAPPSLPCDVADCPTTFVQPWDLPIHMSRVHGIEQEHLLTNLPTLRKIPSQFLMSKQLAEASALNTQMRRISSLEADIRKLDDTYVSNHGLNVTTPWPDNPGQVALTAKLARANRKEKQSRIAGLLLNVRLEALKTGPLIEELEGILRDRSGVADVE